MRKVVAQVALLASAISTFGTGGAFGNFVPRASLCNRMTIDNCALTVKKAILQAQTPEAAVEAWGAWVEALETAYRQFENAPVPPTELDRIEDAIQDKIEDKIESVTNPPQVAFDLAFKKYLPRVASFVEFVEDADGAGEIIEALSPSPLITPVQELSETNKELSDLMMNKVFPIMSPVWKAEYSKIVGDSFREAQIRQP